MTFGESRKKTVRGPTPIRRLAFLIASGLILSCICGGDFVPLDRFSHRNAGTDAPADDAAETLWTEEEVAGEPYRVAVFPSGAEIFLISPGEEETVSTPYVDVVGIAPAETVVTLNDEIAVAGPDGVFGARVPLNEGMNEILCVASDWEGHEAEFSIFIAYEPAG
jgi:hypothetical protein